MQEVKALTSWVIFSALTTPSSTMRQPRLSLSPCAETLPTPVAAVIDVEEALDGKGLLRRPRLLLVTLVLFERRDIRV